MDKTMKEKKIEKVIRHIRKEYLGILFVMPVILGILIFTFTPVCKSLYDSFHTMNMRMELGKFTFENYKKIFTTERTTFFRSLDSTLKYTVLSIPLTMVLSFSLALLLNRETRGIKFARVLCYVPVVIPTVVSGTVWKTLTYSDVSYLNLILKKLGLSTSRFFESNETALPTFLFMGCFGIGSGMILWLSQLKSIPKTLYESADLEGANAWQKLFCITIPMCTPTIFYTLITNIIGTLQVFDMAFMMATPYNDRTLNFLVVLIYKHAFSYYEFVYASALSWMLFVLIGGMSVVVFKTSKWVYYGEDFN